MSLFGAMNTAISGLTAQSGAFGNISDNVANSQTVGFKRVDTSFVDYLTESTRSLNDSGSVVARPDYVNNVQGTITQTDKPLAMAIAGQGFFAVSEQNGQAAGGQPTFAAQQFYSRAGDFALDKNGYMTNSAGQFLNGWTVDPTTGVANQNALAPIQIPQTTSKPVATAKVSLSANLPATPAAGTATATSPIGSNVNVYDALGTAHTVMLNWTQNAANDWTMSVNAPDATTPAVGSAHVLFGAASNNPVPAGGIGDINNASGNVAAAGYAAGGPAALTLTMDFGSGPQAVTLDLGSYGAAAAGTGNTVSTGGVTQYAGTGYNLRSLTQDGVPPGSFTGVATQANGNVVINYDNGQSRVVARVPLVTFSNPEALQRQNGQSFTATTDSGTPLTDAANSNGAGNLITGSVESSNVDIASEFSKLIVAQRAYSANTKIVTTSDELLQQTIDMKR